MQWNSKCAATYESGLLRPKSNKERNIERSFHEVKPHRVTEAVGQEDIVFGKMSKA